MKNKSKLAIGIALCALVVFLVLFVHQQEVENTQRVSVLTNSIQQKAQLIDLEKGYEVKTLNNDQFLGQMTDGGGQLDGYFKDGKIHKIVERVGLSYGVKTYEYYFSNEQLISVNEKEEIFSDPGNTGTLDYTKLKPIFEGNYYFDSDKLINSQTNGKKRFSDDGDSNVELSFLTMAKHNIELLKNIK